MKEMHKPVEDKKMQQLYEKVILYMSSIIENVPYLLTKGYNHIKGLAGSTTGNTVGGSHSSNSSSHSGSGTRAYLGATTGNTVGGSHSGPSSSHSASGSRANRTIEDKL